jgi:tripartite-type tricarboxylate transporter receptor subunit TctC
MTLFHGAHRTAGFAGLLSVLAAMLLAAQPGAAQSVEQFYKGKTTTLLVGYAPGGINDIAGRLLARHIVKYIPGNPNMIVQNMPGAGGLVTANHLYNIAEKDGSVIAGLGRAVPQLAYLDDPNARFDPLKFTWLGSSSSYADDAYVLLLNTKNPANSVADLKKEGPAVKLGAVSAGSTNLIFAILAKEVAGLNVDIIRGYTGAAPIFLAMQNGELDGQVIGLGSVKAGQAHLWNTKQVKALVQFGRATRLPELPDVPTGRELVTDPKNAALLEFAELPFFMALPFVAPPALPPARAKALQDAFMAVHQDKDFLNEAKKLDLDISPISGDEVAKLLERTAQTPKDVIARYNDIVNPPKK